MRRKTDAEFKAQVKSLVGDEYTFLESYKNSSTKILVRHNTCGRVYPVTPNNFLHGTRCAKCVLESQKKTDTQFKTEVKSLVGDEYITLETYKGVNTKIWFKHKKCGRKFKMAPGTFLEGSRCPKCVRERRRKSHSEFKAEVKELTGNEYVVLEKYKTCDATIKFKHLKCGNIFYMCPNNFLHGQRCPKCSKKKAQISRRKTNDQFQAEVKVTTGDEYLVLDKYETNDTKIKFQHKKCGLTFDMRPDDFLSGGHRCPYCSPKKGHAKRRKSPQAFKNLFDKMTDDDYVLASDYKTAKQKVSVLHLKCGSLYKVDPYNFLKGTRCPYCQSSRGERAVAKYLRDKKISFEPQFKIADCKDKMPLPFDFAVFNKDKSLNCLIEYQGEQHFYNPFKRTKHGNFALSSILSTQKHDAIKLKYCKEHGIKLIRINHLRTDSKSNYLKYIKQLVDKTLNKELHVV